ncbi:MAG: PDC sensor domain-containing protein [Prevotella sp.]|nr:PDC sensor domain-containing protein [Prevotella sp.]
MKKYILSLIVVVVIMFGMMAAAQYIMIKHGSQAEQLAEVSRQLEQSKKISQVKTQVERAVWTTQKMVEKNLSNPDGFYAITNQLVRINPNIVGAGVAFRPGYYAKKGKSRLFAPYAYDEEPSVTLKKKKSSVPNIRTKLLSFDYIERDWFKNPVTDGKSFWSDPYMDQGGTSIVMCTFANAVRDEQGHIVAVIFADVPMEDVTIISDDRPSDFTDDIWLLLGLMLVCLLAFCIIIWRAVVASINYKDNKIDVDKRNLIEEIEKLKDINHRLTERNVDLTRKVRDLMQKTDSHYFG